MVYIRQRDLPGLKLYKYSGVDKSLLSKYILKPFYSNVVIKCFPMSIAPNMITLSGFFFVVINFLTMLWYNPNLDTDCPSWVYASWAVGLFLYQTFDAVDGSQARRTGQSGPLGELFDHGVDACNTTLEVLLFAAAMNLGQTWLTILTMFGSSLTFYVQTWDEYYTQTLTLGLISGPVEGIITLCIVYAFTAFKGGASFWHRSMLETIGFPKTSFVPGNIYDMPFTQWYVVYGGLVLLFSTANSILNVMNVRRERGQNIYTPLYGLLPAVVTWTLVPAYLHLQPAILENHLLPFVLFVGLINAYSVGQMITAHLIRGPFPYQNILLLPLALGVLDSLAPALGLWPSSVLGEGMYQVAFVFLCFGLGIGIYGSFVFDVITTICDYLDIWCLTIKYPIHQGKEKEKVPIKKKM